MELLYGISTEIKRELQNPSEEEVSTSDITAAQRRATRLINAYLGSIVMGALPWTDRTGVPAIVDTLAEELAVYYIKRAKHPGPAPLDNSIKVEYYDKAIGVLEQIQKGQMSIPELESVISASLIQCNRENYRPTFDVDEDINQTQDENLLEDITDSRLV